MSMTAGFYRYGMCFMAQDNLTERMKRIFDMLHELFRISHFLSPPFFPVGGYYNKRPYSIKRHRYLGNTSYQDILNDMCVHTHRQNIPFHKTGFF